MEGPSSYGKKIINPQAVRVAQSVETHIAPGGRTSKHRHMNGAVFFVLKGKGTMCTTAGAATGKPATR